MELEDCTHGVDVGLEQFEMDVLVTREGVHFLEFGVEFETDLVVV